MDEVVTRERSCRDGDEDEGDRSHRVRGSGACSQPLFRFRRQPAVGPGALASYLGMTAHPEERPVENGWSALVRTVKFRHSACAARRRTERYWQVRMARSRG